jgi:hypothetical protein
VPGKTTNRDSLRTGKWVFRVRLDRPEWIGRKESGQKGTTQPFNMFWELDKIICNKMQRKKKILEGHEKMWKQISNSI